MDPEVVLMKVQPYIWVLLSWDLVSSPSEEGSLGTIQVLRRQRGGWVGSENGNF